MCYCDRVKQAFYWSTKAYAVTVLLPSFPWSIKKFPYPKWSLWIIMVQYNTLVPFSEVSIPEILDHRRKASVVKWTHG